MPMTTLLNRKKKAWFQDLHHHKMERTRVCSYIQEDTTTRTCFSKLILCSEKQNTALAGQYKLYLTHHNTLYNTSVPELHLYQSGELNNL